jgi:hypothetical protein
LKLLMLVMLVVVMKLMLVFTLELVRKLVSMDLKSPLVLKLERKKTLR